jgi:hypothetical protein
MRTTLIVLLLTCGAAAGATPTEELRRAQALEILNDGEDADQGTFAVKRWTAGGPKLWVAAGVFGETLVAAVLRESGDELELLAQSEGEEPVTAEPLWSADVTLDVIPYRISPSDVAFGVRVRNTYVSTGRSSHSDGLHLYRWSGSALRPIFAELVTDFSSVLLAEHEREETGSEWVLIVSERKHKGFFDLLLREKVTKKTRTFRWDGERYRE